MADSYAPSYKNLLIAAILLAILGWMGLYFLLTTTLPTVGPRWLLFFLATVALTGTTLPFVWLLHRRFRSHEPAPEHVLLRQGLAIGLYGSLCLWLQINRSLTLPLAALLAGGLSAFEWVLRMVERSRWRAES